MLTDFNHPDTGLLTLTVTMNGPDAHPRLMADVQTTVSSTVLLIAEL
jgi:hypothetical protein